MYSQATLRLLNACITGCDEFASNQLWEKFDYSFLYLIGLEDQFSATEDTVVYLDSFWISKAA